MIYKSNLKESNCIVNNNDKRYIVKKTEDVIELRFDEDNQAFYARIKNPSQHTKYLYDNNKLAIALCKMNCGNETLHGHFCKNHYDEEEDKCIPSSFVKRNKHPRWSRCGKNIAPVLDNLDDEYEIGITQTQRINGRSYEIGIDDFYPEPRHTVGNKWDEKWYNSVKAVLLSSPLDLTRTRNIAGCRAYRTMCKRIKIEYDSTDEMIIHRREHGNINPYGISVNVTQNNREITFNITHMNEKVLQAFRNDALWIGLDFQDISYATNHGGNNKREHNGNNWEESSPGENSYDSRRYEYRLSQKWYCSSRLRTPIYYEGSDTPTIRYSIPNTINSHKLSGSGIFNLLRLMRSHNDVEDLDLSHRMPRVVIGMTENDAGRRLFKYIPNLIVDFTYSNE